jgi:hypothetical protein
MTANDSTSSSDKDPATSTDRELFDEPFPVSTDEVFDVLKNKRRRHLVRYLDAEHDIGDTIPAGTAADHVVARETNTDLHDADAATRKSVYVALTSSHFENLANAGLITWDDTRNEITVEATLSPLVDLLDLIDQDSDH